MDNRSAYWEAWGLRRISELGLPTVTCIYPETKQEITQDVLDRMTSRDDYLLTIVDHRLKASGLFGEVYKPEVPVLGNIFQALATMHKGNFIHGDAHLGNFSVRTENNEIVVHSIDPEYCIDMNSVYSGLMLEDQNSGRIRLHLNAIKRRLGEESFSALSKEELALQIHKEAASADIRRLMQGIQIDHPELQEMSEEEKQKVKADILKMLKESYFSQVTDELFYDQEFTTLVESQIKQLWIELD